MTLLIAIARKPIVGAVVLNAIKHGCGGISVDGCRIDSDGTHESAARAGHGKGYENTPNKGTFGAGLGGRISAPHFDGRWPANVLLQHNVDCRQNGIVTIGHGERHKAKPGQKPFTDARGWNEHEMTRDGAHAPDNYGVESIPNWCCSDSCPIPILDRSETHEAGNRGKMTNHVTPNRIYCGSWTPMGNNPKYHEDRDPSKPSRFFKQVRE